MAQMGSYFKRFVHGISHRDQVDPHMLYESAENLLLSVPPARPSVLQFYTHVLQDYFRLFAHAQNSQYDVLPKLEKVLHRVLDIISQLIKRGDGEAYRKLCVLVCQWCLNNLGDLSRKFTNLIIGNSGGSLDDIGSKWRQYPVVKHLIDVTELSFPYVSNVASSHEDDHAIKILLQASSRFSPSFDWMIAHLGGQYPEVIIRRIILSSLSDFAAGGSDEGAMKFQSAINILQHFQSANGPHLRQVLSSLIQDSFQSSARSFADSYRPLVPFLLLLASSGGDGLRILITGLVADLLEKSNTISLINFFNGYTEVERKSFRQMAIHVLMQDEQESGARIVKHLLISADTTTDPSKKAAASSTELTISSASLQLLVNLCGRILRRFYGLHVNGTGSSLPGVGLLKSLSNEMQFLSARVLNLGCTFSAKLLLSTILACQPAAMPDLIECLLLQEKSSRSLLTCSNCDTGMDKRTMIFMNRQTVRILLHLLDGMELNRSGLLAAASHSALDIVHSQSIRQQAQLLDMFYFMLRAEHGQRQRVVTAISQHAGTLLSLMSLSYSDDVANKVLQLLTLADFTTASGSPRLSESIMMVMRLSNLLVNLLSASIKYNPLTGLSNKNQALICQRRRLRWQRGRRLLLTVCKVRPYSRIAALRVLLRAIMTSVFDHSVNSVKSDIGDSFNPSPKLLLDSPPPDSVAPSTRQCGQLKRRAPIVSKLSSVQKMHLFSKHQLLLDLIWDVIHTSNSSQGFLVLADVFQETVFSDDPVWTYARNDRKAPVSCEAAARVYRRFCEARHLWSILEILCGMDRIPLERIYFVLLALLSHLTNYFSSTLKSGSSLNESAEITDAFCLLRCLRLGGALPENLWRMDYLSGCLTAQDMVTILSQVRITWQKPELMKKRKDHVIGMVHSILHSHIEISANMFDDFTVMLDGDPS